ncbi:MAG: bifunctional hydroxymethylpyrimidine kinase/phosphomethylpyrimidine kinase [Planctomycetota bacterium]|jgi:hydroxymethylpyrimidine/phosphomethylpyrimidine kinase|nr:bifunctional hydroxymethylpyrimidine kinase/phosphomethylpyrimidine kinase [Planctomycetota bacterium]
MVFGRPTTILCVGGNDDQMGAGLQMDFAVAKALGFHAHLAPTMDTVQTVAGLQSVELRDHLAVGRMMLDALSDGVDAIKIGALGDEKTVEVVVEVLDPWQRMLPIIYDPVSQATSFKEGACLNTREGVALAEKRLLPMASLATPNTIEYGNGHVYLECPGVLQKGGHAQPFTEFEDGIQADWVCDLLQLRGQPKIEFRHQRLAGVNDIHGTGCALSSLVTCYLADGLDMDNSVTTALRVMEEWLRAAIAADGVLRPEPPSIKPGTWLPSPRDADGVRWL